MGACAPGGVIRKIWLHGRRPVRSRRFTTTDRIRAKLLSDPEITAAYGNRDMWQVVTRWRRSPRGAANTYSYRTMMRSTIISGWQRTLLSCNNKNTRFPLRKIRKSRSVDRGKVNGWGCEVPSDADLLNACEQWLAVSVYQMSRLITLPPRAEARTSTAR